MGLTIHYSLSTDLKTATDVHTLVEAIRQFALDLPFKQVSDLKEFSAADPEQDDDEDRWLRIQAEASLERNGRHYRVPPKRIVAFSAWPGEGCEPANIGFCQYPSSIVADGKRLRTGLNGWSWSSFCKTQYASNPDCGGIANFVRCHLLVIKTLDFIRSTGLAEVHVDDEGGYDQQRDIQALVKEVGSWNELLAGLTNQIREATGPALESAITRFPNFEHLEAKGLERLKKLREERDGR